MSQKRRLPLVAAFLFLLESAALHVGEPVVIGATERLAVAQDHSDRAYFEHQARKIAVRAQPGGEKPE